ncbi:MAG: gluconeogenesis factor YvcK family protein [Patescibacteria group bacterium]|nr:YvcK family protein [Patescibacteria group bacterium]
MKTQRPNVVVIGGGTGSFTVLSGLKDYDVSLSAIITTMDSGGSTGKLRDQLGVLPPGDLRQALVALSEAPEIWRNLFLYRFEKGDLKGHNFGNIFLSAIEKITNSNQEALDRASQILQTNGRVIPVTFSKTSLCAEYEDGTIVKGEDGIGESHKRGKISRMFLNPKVQINLEAKRAMERADYIIFGPGDLYTSIIPNLLVSGMQETLSHLNAKGIFVINLMRKPDQTRDFKVSTFIDELEKYTGKGFLDCVVVNTKKPSRKLITRYKKVDRATPIEDDVGKTYSKAKIVRSKLLSKEKIKISKSDGLDRSLIRHDPYKLARVLFSIISS